jgi:hypothetical protein
MAEQIEVENGCPTDFCCFANICSGSPNSLDIPIGPKIEDQASCGSGVLLFDPIKFFHLKKK